MSEKSPYASFHEEESGARNAKPDSGDAGATFVLESKGLIFSKSSPTQADNNWNLTE